MTFPKLLFIDDDSIANYLVGQLMQELSVAQYTLTQGAAEALDFLEQAAASSDFPELIFVDLKMPLMDGFEFIEEFERRFASTFPHTRLMVLSSSISAKDRTRALRYKSVIEFLTKPLDTPTLLQAFEKFERSNSPLV